MDEKRTTPRARVLLAGKIRLKDGGVIDCTLRNRSSNGARLRVTSVIGIPDTFVLVSEPDGVQRAVQVVWRKVGELGVRYA